MTDSPRYEGPPVPLWVVVIVVWIAAILMFLGVLVGARTGLALIVVMGTC